MQPLSLTNLDLNSLVVRPITKEEKPTWNHLIKTYHYLHSCRLVGESIRYIATFNDQWVALLGWTSGAFKLVARDEWIGWTEKQRMERWGSWPIAHDYSSCLVCRLETSPPKPSPST